MSSTLLPLGKIRSALLLVLFAVAGVSVLADESVNRSVSAVYARESAALLEEDTQAAERLAEISLEYDPTNPDSLHLLARVYSEDQSRTTDAVALLEEALSSSRRFQFTSERAARLRLAQLLTDTGRASQAVEVLRPVYSANNPDANVLFGLASAYFSGGAIALGEEFAELGMQLFAEDIRFFSLLVRRNPTPEFSVLRRLRTDRRYGESAYLSALLHYVRHAATGADRATAIDLYRDSGGSDPIHYAYEFRVSEPARVTQFVDAGGADDLYAVRYLYGRIESAAARRQLLSAVGQLDGRFGLDESRNGRFEAFVEFRSGELTGWSVDGNTDGVYDLSVDFLPGEGLPAAARVEGGRTTYVYRAYPEVERVQREDEILFVRPGELEFRSIPNAEQWFEDIHDRGPVFPYPIQVDVELPRNDEIFSSTYLRQLLSAEGVVVASERLLRGEVVLRSEDSTGDGRVDRVTYFEQGIPVRAIRDVTGDGTFAVFEEYRSGELFAVGYDSNQDGIYDYVEQQNNGTRREWDTDGTGNVNIRFERFADSTTRSAFLEFLGEEPKPIDRIWTAPFPMF